MQQQAGATGGTGTGAGAELQVVPVWEMMQKVLESFSVRTRLSDVRLEVQLEIEDGEINAERRAHLERLRVMGKEVQLRRVVSSLLSNALQYSREGGTVKVSAKWINFTAHNFAAVADEQRSNASSSSSQCCTCIQLYPQTLDSAEAGGVTAEVSTEPAHLAPTRHSSSWQQQGDRLGMARAGVVRLAVKDEGTGMTPEQTAQVFGDHKRFSISALQAGQGSGIGLFVCKSIAEQHRAAISVTSEGPGLGSTYTLDLPVYASTATPYSSFNHSEPHNADGASLRSVSDQDQDQDQSATGPGIVLNRSSSSLSKMMIGAAEDDGSAHENACDEGEEDVHPDGGGGVDKVLQRCPSLLDLVDECSNRFRNKRILVVDDAPSNRKMLVRVLSKSGHTCGQAQDGQVCLDMYLACDPTAPYEVILMDFEMLVMNGPTATKRLRELGCSCPIVGVTGNVLAADVEFFVNQGADAVLPKPLQMGALEEVWDRFVGMKDASSKNHYEQQKY